MVSHAYERGRALEREQELERCGLDDWYATELEYLRHDNEELPPRRRILTDFGWAVSQALTVIAGVVTLGLVAHAFLSALP